MASIIQGKLLTRYTIVVFLTALTLFFVGCEKKKVDRRAVMQIKSTPTGAKVSIDYKEIGVTPLVLKVPPGTHIVKLEKKNYQTAWEKVECEERRKVPVEVSLAPVSASAMIVSEPSGANVEIDGRVVGVTPLTLYNLPVGTHSAILKSVNHSPREVTWEVKNERPQLVKISLMSNVGELVITSVPSRAQLTINGEPRGFTPFKGMVEQGVKKVVIEKEGYAVVRQSVTVEKGQTTRYNASLQILPGSLSITSSPKGAEVYLNEKRYGNTPELIEGLQPGEYKLRLVLAGFDPYIRNVTISPGKKSETRCPLDSNTGGIDLYVSPPGVTIYLDGKKVGVSEPSDHKNIPKVFQIRDLSMGKHTLTFAHKLATPQTKKISVNVRKGKITRLRNIEMWIANTILLLKDGTKMTGRIRADNQQEDEIIFEPEPHIAQRYAKEEIKSITPLKRKE